MEKLDELNSRVAALTGDDKAKPKDVKLYRELVSGMPGVASYPL